jgi:hypothetical protein
MGFLSNQSGQKAIGNGNKPGVMEEIKQTYKQNDRLIHSVGKALLMVAALRIAADYMQKQN